MELWNRQGINNPYRGQIVPSDRTITDTTTKSADIESGLPGSGNLPICRILLIFANHKNPESDGDEDCPPAIYGIPSRCSSLPTNPGLNLSAVPCAPSARLIAPPSPDRLPNPPPIRHRPCHRPQQIIQWIKSHNRVLPSHNHQVLIPL